MGDGFVMAIVDQQSCMVSGMEWMGGYKLRGERIVIASGEEGIVVTTQSIVSSSSSAFALGSSLGAGLTARTIKIEIPYKSINGAAINS